MNTSEVVIVGAGPTGLALSLTLARYGVPSVVLDNTTGDVTPRAARSCVLRPDTAAWLPDTVRAYGTRWNRWSTWRRRQRSHEVELDAHTSPLHLEQHVLERSLRDALAEQPLARIATGSHLDLLEQDADGVTAHTRTRHPETTAAAGSGAAHAQHESGVWWRGSFLVGCDGARSTVRKLLGVRFPGRTAVERHAVAALRAELPWEDEARLYREPGGDGSEITARPLPGGVWRLDWLLPPRGELVTPEQLLDRVDSTLKHWHRTAAEAHSADGDRADREDGTAARSGRPAPENRSRVRGTDPSLGSREPRAHPPSGTGHTGGPYELLDTGVHTAHQRLARSWRVGRAFLAGDAAHVMGALGLQSVDEGLRDAANLAWKLALAWHDANGSPGHGHRAHRDSTENLLDSYETERRGAVVARLRAVDQALPLVRREGGSLRALLPGGTRGHLGLLTEGHLGQGQFGAPAAYARSPLTPSTRSVDAVPAGTAPGALVQDVPVTALDGSRGRLWHHLGGQGGELLVVLVAPGTGVWDSRHWLTAGLMPELAAAVDALPIRAQLLVAEDYPGAAAHTVLVVRPDGHLVASLPAARTGQLATCADAVRGHRPELAAQTAAKTPKGARPSRAGAAGGTAGRTRTSSTGAGGDRPSGSRSGASRSNGDRSSSGRSGTDRSGRARFSGERSANARARHG